MAEDVGPTNPGVDPTFTEPATGRSQTDYTPALAQGQTAKTEALEEAVSKPGEQYQLQAVLADSYLVKVFNGTTTVEPSILIARPPTHRLTFFDGNTIGDKTYNYLGVSERTVESDEEFLHQFLEPAFITGFDILYAIEVPSTGVSGIVLQEINVDGRSWVTTSKVLRYKIVTINNDHLVCNLVNRDGTVGSDAIEVLKPRALRHIAAVVGNGRAFVYTAPQKKTVSAVVGGPFAGETDEGWIVIPAYETGDIVHARRVQGGAEIPVDVIEGSDDLFMDINTDGRAWAVEG